MQRINNKLLEQALKFIIVEYARSLTHHHILFIRILIDLIVFLSRDWSSAAWKSFLMS